MIITGMMDDWPAMRKWNLDFFQEQFGDRDIEVQMGRNAGGNYEIEREKFIKTIKFSQFIEMIRSSNNTNDFISRPTTTRTTKRPCPSCGTISFKYPNIWTARTISAAFSGWARQAPSHRSTMT